MATKRRQLIDACGDNGRLQQVVEELYNIALQDKHANYRVQAAKVLLDHFLGKPPQSFDVTLDDGKPSGLTLADLQLAILQLPPESRVLFAAAIRQRRTEAATAIVENGSVESGSDR